MCEKELEKLIETLSVIAACLNPTVCCDDFVTVGDIRDDVREAFELVNELYTKYTYDYDEKK